MCDYYRVWHRQFRKTVAVPVVWKTSELGQDGRGLLGTANQDGE